MISSFSNRHRQCRTTFEDTRMWERDNIRNWWSCYWRRQWQVGDPKSRHDGGDTTSSISTQMIWKFFRYKICPTPATMHRSGSSSSHWSTAALTHFGEREIKSVFGRLIEIWEREASRSTSCASRPSSEAYDNENILSSQMIGVSNSVSAAYSANTSVEERRVDLRRRRVVADLNIKMKDDENR